MKQSNGTNNLTELVFILDRSGSMRGLEGDTIGGFNATLEKQRKQPGECYVSTVLFDNTSTVLHDRIALDRVPDMTANRHIGNIHKYARAEDVPAHTVFVIMTDGMENASRRYSSDEVKAKIERQKEEYGWEFLFLGANIDAVETAKQFGIDESRAANYNADADGTRIAYECVEAAVCAVRANRPLSPGWSRKVETDHKTRKSKR